MTVKRSQSAAKVLQVLEGVAAYQPVGVSALSRRLGADKSAVQRALMTLADDGWIQPSPGAQWELTPRLLAAARMPSTIQTLRKRARDVLESLRRAAGETVFMTVPDGARFVIVEALESSHQMRLAPPIGMVVPVRGSATGQAVLAFCDHDRRRDLLCGEPEQGLLDVLTACRARGYALSDATIDPGSVSFAAPFFAAPLFAAPPNPAGAIVLAGPRGRIQPARYDHFGALVSEAAGALTMQLAHGD